MMIYVKNIFLVGEKVASNNKQDILQQDITNHEEFKFTNFKSD